MIKSLAIANYRSLLDVRLRTGSLSLITGANGAGKSNLYRALRLLAQTAEGGLIPALAAEGGLRSVIWAGPESLSRAMRQGKVPIQGGPRQHAARLKLGYSADDFSYLIELGLPPPNGHSLFALDPEIKRECIWVGPAYRPAACLLDRNGPVVKVRDGRSWRIIAEHLPAYHSCCAEVADFNITPELYEVRQAIRSWRFYDHFRTDRESPARQPQLGTRTPVLSHDGRDLAAAIQTIVEIGQERLFNQAVEDAFPGASIAILAQPDGRFELSFSQPGLLRPLSAAELSDGTLRYLLLVAALLTPRPPRLMVLNEPETSLHPDLLPALGRLIIAAAERSQVWVVSHANRLINTLLKSETCHQTALEKCLGQTLISGVDPLEQPPWHWS